MKHFFYIDPIEKLNTKKDSSLFMALTLQDEGEEVYVLFDKDFYVTNFQESIAFEAYEFTGKIDEDFYISKFKIKNKKIVTCEKGDFIHFRLDPPVTESYLKSAWLLRFLEVYKGVNILNSPEGILLHNEKLLAYEDDFALDSCIGSSISAFEEFSKKLTEDGYKEAIFKPLNSFSGFGIKKISLGNSFSSELLSFYKPELGSMVMQPFLPEVQTKGEVRTIFWIGEEIGTIRKFPPEGSYLSNIAQGAKFHVEPLAPHLRKKCEEICWKLKEQGVLLVAFDILAEKISEVNITCPGLLVEVSHAMKENLVKKMIPNLQG